MKTYTFSVDWFMEIEAESFQEARWEAMQNWQYYLDEGFSFSCKEEDLEVEK